MALTFMRLKGFAAIRIKLFIFLLFRNWVRMVPYHILSTCTRIKVTQKPM
jgi:hypothetical protein